jgi:hypothetical protein
VKLDIVVSKIHRADHDCVDDPEHELEGGLAVDVVDLLDAVAIVHKGYFGTVGTDAHTHLPIRDHDLIRPRLVSVCFKGKIL